MYNLCMSFMIIYGCRLDYELRDAGTVMGGNGNLISHQKYYVFSRQGCVTHDAHTLATRQRHVDVRCLLGLRTYALVL